MAGAWMRPERAVVVSIGVALGSTGLVSAQTDIGAAGLTVTNAADAGLTNPVTFLGGVDQGTLTVTAGAGVVGAQDYTLTGNGQFNILAAGGAFGTSGLVTGAGAVIVTGGGTLILGNGLNDYTGGTTITNGGVQVADGGAIGTGTLTFNAGVGEGATLEVMASTTFTQAVQLTSAGTIDVAGGSIATMQGEVSGDGTLSVAGGGTLVLENAANDYTGGTTITNGAVQVTDGAALGTGVITLNGALAGLVVTSTASLTQDISLGAGGSIAAADGTTTTVSGTVSGAGSLTLSNTGTVVLTGANTYTGDTFISGGGTLSVSAADNLGASATIQFMNLGGTLEVTGAAVTLNQAVQLGADASISTANSLTLSGAINGAETLGVSGGGTVAITADNSAQAWGTAIVNGTLEAEAVNLGSGDITFNAGAGQTATLLAGAVGGSAYAQDVVLTSGGTIQVGAGESATMDGVISGAGALTVAGAGTLELTGNNTFTGGIDLAGGTLEVATNAALGGADGDITFSAAGVVLSATGTFTMDRDLQMDAAGTISVAAGETLSMDGRILGTGQLTVDGGGTLALSDTNSSWTGGVLLETGTVEVTTVGVLGGGTFTFAAGGDGVLHITGGNPGGTNFELAGDGTFEVDATELSGTIGVVSGAGRLILTGGGGLQLTGDNTYSGGTEIRDGNLSINEDDDLGDAAGDVEFNAGVGETATLTFGDTFTTARDFTLTSAGTISVSANDTATLSGVITGAGQLTVEGAGTLALEGTNTWTGGVLIDGGTLAVSETGNLGTGGITLDNGGELSATGDVTISQDITVGADGGTLLVGTNDVMTITAAATLTGAGDLEFRGAGGETDVVIEQLMDGSLYTGTATLTNIDVECNGLIGGDVIVASQSRLQGEGFVVGLVTVQDNAALVAGTDAIGTFEVGALDVQAGGILAFEALNNGASITFDQFVIAADADLADNAEVNILQNGFLPDGESMAYLNAAGTVTVGDITITGFLADAQGDPVTVLPINTYSIDADGNVVVARAADAFQAAAETAGGDASQIGAASGLDSLAAIADSSPFGSTADFVYSMMLGATDNAALLAELTGLSPQTYSTTLQGMVESARLVADSQMDYLADRRHAYGNAQWWAGNNASLTASARAQDVVPALNARKNALADPAAGGQQLNVYGRFLGGQTSVDAIGEQASYTQNSYDALAGADYFWRPGILVGATLGYLRDNISQTGGSSADSNAVLMGLYGTFGGDEGLYCDLLLNGTVNFWDTSRVVSSGPSTNTASFTSWSFAVGADVGYDWYLTDEFLLSPIGSLLWVHAQNPGFTESGGNTALSVQSVGQDNLLLSVGPKMTLLMEMDNRQELAISTGFGFQYLVGDQSTIYSSFALGGSSWPTTIANPDRSRFYINFGVAWPISDQTELRFSYDGLFSGDTSANAGSVQVSIHF